MLDNEHSVPYFICMRYQIFYLLKFARKIRCLCSKMMLNHFPSTLQLLLFLKGFTESERNKLAMLTGILLANGSISASILNSLFNENLVKEGEPHDVLNGCI